MGRPRKPNSLKILEGAQPCRINRDEPNPPAFESEVPEFLDEVGRIAWVRVTTRLDEMGILTAADSEAIALYASIYSRWQAATLSLAEDGLTIINRTEIKTSKGSTSRTVSKAHPAVQIAAECQSQMTRLLTQFGMTPSSRSSLHVPIKSQEDKLLGFIRSKPGRKKA
jgi:P27 family predicted phage terminase small subunit